MSATIDELDRVITPAMSAGYLAYCEACGELIGRFPGDYRDRPRVCLVCQRVIVVTLARAEADDASV